jgi:LasA protease
MPFDQIKGKIVRVKRTIRLTILLIWLLPALACNLPVAPHPAAPPEMVVHSPSPTPLPLNLDGQGKSAPGNPITTPLPAPTQLPAPDGAKSWSFPGLNILGEFPSGAAAGAMEWTVSGSGPVSYFTQPGDTLPALAKRFLVPTSSIHSNSELPSQGLLPPATQLEIDTSPSWTLPSAALLPDSEINYGPAQLDFSVESYVRDAGAFLSTYTENVDGETLSGAQIVQRVADELSINPRLLLAFLEFRTGWVLGWPKEPVDTDYPIGFAADGYRGLYKELGLAARQLSIGYYLWRAGALGTLQFPKGDPARLSPKINAGTAAISLLFSNLYPRSEFGRGLYGANGFTAFYRFLFGDPWARAATYEPLYQPDMMKSLPFLELPFAAGEKWSFTGGPHPDWSTGSPSGALDFAPTGEGRGCYVSRQWATAAAAGVVVRSGGGEVVLSLDSSENEHKGWAILYLHLASQDRAPVGMRVQSGDPLGHPSCEGGVATGTHVHIARKYNGEWVGIGPDTPLELSGWRVEPGPEAYLGRLIRADGTVVEAKSDGSSPSLIIH